MKADDKMKNKIVKDQRGCRKERLELQQAYLRMERLLKFKEFELFAPLHHYNVKNVFARKHSKRMYK